MKKDRMYVAFSKKKKTIVDQGIAGWTIGQYVHIQLKGADKIKFK